MGMGKIEMWERIQRKMGKGNIRMGREGEDAS